MAASYRSVSAPSPIAPFAEHVLACNVVPGRIRLPALSRAAVVRLLPGMAVCTWSSVVAPATRACQHERWTAQGSVGQTPVSCAWSSAARCAHPTRENYTPTQPRAQAVGFFVLAQSFYVAMLTLRDEWAV